MPALTMRGRYLMREYWSDSDLFLRLNAAERELYIGLWMLADDQGWLPRDIPGIAAALFRYENRDPRENRVRAGLRRLQDLHKVESNRCGCLHLPAVERYPRAGKKSTEHGTFHRTRHRSNGTNDIQTDTNPSPDVLPSSSRLISDVARAPEGQSPSGAALTEFRRKVPKPA
jgi:hypothetical protein